DGTVGVGERPSTIVAPQALLMMNNPQVREWAKSFAARAGKDAKTPEEAIRRADRIAVNRDPKGAELTDGGAFVKREESSYNGMANARELALTDFCQVVMCLSEVMYVE